MKIQVKHLSQPITRFYFCEQCITYVSFIYEDGITDLFYSTFFSSSSSVFVLNLQILFPHSSFLSTAHGKNRICGLSKIHGAYSKIEPTTMAPQQL